MDTTEAMSQKIVCNASWEHYCEVLSLRDSIHNHAGRPNGLPHDHQGPKPWESRTGEELFQTEFSQRVRMSRHEWFWMRSFHWGLLGQLAKCRCVLRAEWQCAHHHLLPLVIVPCCCRTPSLEKHTEIFMVMMYQVQNPISGNLEGKVVSWAPGAFVSSW